MTTRVLHISSPTTWRGGEQQIAYLVSELHGKDTKQTLMTPQNSELSERMGSSVDIVPFKKRGGVDPFLASKIKKECTQHSIDIIHCHDAQAHAAAVLSAAIFGNSVPVVLSRRVDFPVKDKWFSRWKYNHRSIKAILCVSDEIKRITKPAITNSNIILETVHSGIDLSRESSTEKVDIRSELGIASSNRIVANVAALADHKDYFTFLRTAKDLSDREDISFVIFGSGPLEDEIKSFAKSLDLKNTYFAGFRKNLHVYWKEMDVLLFTSKTEGLGTSLLDSLANRVPVVATKAGGIPEIITHDHNGFLAEVGDHESLGEGVIKMLNDEAYRKKSIENGWEKVQQFSKAETARKTLAMYQKVLSEKL